jgi:HicB-like antitoxin of HicAB toxin-antitoxin system
MASDALDLHIRGMIEDRELVHEPLSLDTIMADADNRNAVAFLVDVATEPMQSIRANVMLPVDLVEAIDPSTDNRSRFLTDAARAKLPEVF